MTREPRQPPAPNWGAVTSSPRRPLRSPLLASTIAALVCCAAVAVAAMLGQRMWQPSSQPQLAKVSTNAAQVLSAEMVPATATTAGVTFTVTDVTVGISTVGPKSSAVVPDGFFTAVTLELHNTGDRPFDPSGSSFGALTNQWHSLPVDLTATGADPDSGTTWRDRITPGATATITLYFDTPPTEQVESVVFTPTGEYPPISLRYIER